MLKLVGISGKARHGKDTLARVLAELYFEHGVVRRAFADALKEDIFSLLVGNNGAWGEAYKNCDFPWSPCDYMNIIKDQPEIRALLQTYGMAQRLANPLHWVGRLMQWGNAAHEGGANVLIIPDVRFPNEAEAIRNHGGIVIRITRPRYWNGLSKEAAAHPSETALDKYTGFAAHIYNDGDEDRLRSQSQGNAIELYVRRGSAIYAMRGAE